MHHTTLVHHLFYGGTRDVVQCRVCGHASTTRDTFVCLSLELPRGVDTVDQV